MHDPMTVAHEVPSFIPERVRWRERGGRRWGFDVSRRTNTENLGERTYPWWRLKGYTLRLAGRAYGLRTFITIWHVEPNGRDSGEVCRHYVRSRDPQPPRWRVRISPFLKAHPRREIPEDPAAGRAWIADRGWKWHVHHWKIQVHYSQRLRRFLLERCELCGHRYPWAYAPVSHGWDQPGVRWRDGVTRRAYHHECSALVSLRNTKEEDEATIRALVAEIRYRTDASEEEVINRLFSAWCSNDNGTSNHAGFRRGSRIAHMHGYKMRQRDARWVHPDGQVEELI